MFTSFLSFQDKAWIELLNKFNYDIYHHPNFVKIAADEIDGHAIAYYKETENFRFLVPLIARPIPKSISGKIDLFDCVSPYGYGSPLFQLKHESLKEIPLKKLNDDTDFSEHDTLDSQNKEDLEKTFNFDYESEINSLISSFISACSQNNIISAFIRFHPLINNYLKNWQNFGQLVQHGETVFVNLSKSIEDIYKDFRKMHRQHLSKLKEQNFYVEINNFSSLNKCIEIYNRSMARFNAPKFYFFSDKYYNELIDQFRDNIHLCTVHNADKKIVSFCFFFEINGIVQAHLAATEEEYLVKSPSKLCFYEMIKFFKNRSNIYFHLGGGRGGSKDSLYFFKSGFSKDNTLFYTCRVVTDINNYIKLSNKINNFNLESISNSNKINNKDSDYDLIPNIQPNSISTPTASNDNFTNKIEVTTSFFPAYRLQDN